MNCQRIVVLAAGRGTRLRASAEALDLPEGLSPEHVEDAKQRFKPLFRIDGRPLLVHLLRRAERAGFTEVIVVGHPEDDDLVRELDKWNCSGTGCRMQVECVRQEQPLGTAHALAAALETVKDKTETFVLCNGDNVPTTHALRTLRTSPNDSVLVGFDPMELQLPEDRVFSFAALKVDDSGSLARIEEKPTPEILKEWKDRPMAVSMNLLKLPVQATLDACHSIRPHPVRHEFELPDALSLLMQQGFRLEVQHQKSPVVDVTRLHDVPVAERVLARDEKAMLFEVCASSPMDVEHAAVAGADRVELCAHWSCGGLTPPEADIRASVDWGLPIHALIRPRAGHFVYSEKEKTWMLHQIESALQAGASRAVIGATNLTGHLDLPWLAQAVETFGAHRLVIHRACDLSPDWAVDAKGLAALGLTRILTSGGAPLAIDGMKRIQEWVNQGFQVVVGSGVRPADLPVWRGMGVEAVHASCRVSREMTLSLFDGTTHPVDPQNVEAFVRSLRTCAE